MVLSEPCVLCGLRGTSHAAQAGHGALGRQRDLTIPIFQQRLDNRQGGRVAGQAQDVRYLFSALPPTRPPLRGANGFKPRVG
jgi:adhesin HecA-like repeat protein